MWEISVNGDICIGASVSGLTVTVSTLRESLIRRESRLETFSVSTIRLSETTDKVSKSCEYVLTKVRIKNISRYFIISYKSKEYSFLKYSK